MKINKIVLYNFNSYEGLNEFDFTSDDNNKNIDLGKLIKNKKAIVANKRYFDNPYDTQIDYILDGRHETMYVFYVEDLLVIQVGLSDEGPKFIAYK